MLPSLTEILKQQIGSLASQRFCQSIDNVDRRIVDASLQRTDISSVNPGAISQRFLRQACGLPSRSQIACKNLSNIHVREQRVL